MHTTILTAISSSVTTRGSRQRGQRTFLAENYEDGHVFDMWGHHFYKPDVHPNT